MANRRRRARKQERAAEDIRRFYHRHSCTARVQPPGRVAGRAGEADSPTAPHIARIAREVLQHPGIGAVDRHVRSFTKSAHALMFDEACATTVGDVRVPSILTPDIQNDILTDFVRDLPEYAAPSKKKSEPVAPTLVPGWGSKMGHGVKYVADQMLRLFTKDRLVVVSSNPMVLSAKGSHPRCFARA